MIITDKSENLTKNESLVPVNMGISTNVDDQRHVLTALTSSLYTDKIMAPLREYAANAADANVEAGKPDAPIEVTLPTRLDPTLTIRDFGLGMTEDQILNVFCMLGASTKRGSNAVTGAFGIGSKAGFAYGNSFMVASYVKGLKSIYNCYKERGGFHMAVMLKNDPTDAPDGIEIKVPVRAADMPEFIEKAERVYRYFRVRPIIHGAQIEFDRPGEVYGGKGWRYTGNGTSVAICGNMGYEIDADAMGTLSSKMEHLLNLGVELDFNIGDLEIALNREGLQYVDDTRAAILKPLKRAVAEIDKIFVNKIAAAPNLWEARKLYGELFQQSGTQDVRLLREIVDGTIMWGTHNIKGGQFNVDNRENNPGVFSIISAWRRNGSSLKFKRNLDEDSVYATDTTQIVINDLESKKFSPSRVRGFFKANPDKQLMLIMCYSDDKARDRHWKARELDGAPWIYLSTIVPHVAASLGGSNRSKKHTSRVFELDETVTDISSKCPKSSWWKAAQIDLKTGAGIYVPIDKFLVRIDDYDHPNTLISEVSDLRQHGLVKGAVYGFKPAYVKRLPADSKWVRLDVAVAQELATRVEKQKLAQEMADYVTAQDHCNELFNVSTLDKWPKGTPIHTYLSVLKAMQNPWAPKSLFDFINGDSFPSWLEAPELPTPSNNLDALQQIVFDRYPMIRMARSLSMAHPTTIQTVLDYVKLVEAK